MTDLLSVAVYKELLTLPPFLLSFLALFCFSQFMNSIPMLHVSININPVCCVAIYIYIYPLSGQIFHLIRFLDCLHCLMFPATHFVLFSLSFCSHIKRACNLYHYFAVLFYFQLLFFGWLGPSVSLHLDTA